MGVNKAILISLWVILIGICFYGYNIGVYTVIKQIPLKEANLNILKSNLNKQKKDLQALDSISLNSKELQNKEDGLEKFLFKEDKDVQAKIAFSIEKILQKTGIQVLSPVNFFSDVWSQDNVDRLGKGFEVKQLQNPYADLWFYKISFTTTAQEDGLLKFLEEAEKTPSILLRAVSLTKDADGIKEDFSLRQFYSLSAQTL